MSESVPTWLTPEAGEELHWQGRPRIQTILYGIGVGVVLAVGAFLAELGVPVALLGLVVPIVPVWLWIRNTEYVISSERLYRKTGIVGRDVTAVDLETVQNASYSQSVTGTIFDHGTVEFETAGDAETELAFRFVNAPQSVQSIVDELRSKRRAGSEAVPGSLEQWQAIRDEVRAIRAALES